MNDRKNGLLLSGGLFLCVWLVLFIVAVTEDGGVAYNFGLASTIAGVCGVVCTITWLTLDFMEERRDASGIYSFEYYRLKRRTMKELEKAREKQYSELAYLFEVENIEFYFNRDATIIGIEPERIAADFAELKAAVK